MAIMAKGVRVFQGARLAPTEAGHVSALLGYMDPPRDSMIADMGCGIGEVARLMKQERPDLDFILVNKNNLQLSLVPPCFVRIFADMHATGIPSASADGAMFCYALCHSDFPLALREAARITRPGGFLFVYDYERIRGIGGLFETRLASRAIHRAAMETLAREAGWHPRTWENPAVDDTLFREAYGNDAEYDMIFNDLRVCLWKMERGYISHVG
jgi:SAM-dependent methyltransferase